MHPDDLVIQLIVGGWTGQKSVSIGDEQVENIDHLQRTETHGYILRTWNWETNTNDQLMDPKPRRIKPIQDE